MADQPTPSSSSSPPSSRPAASSARQQLASIISCPYCSFAKEEIVPTQTCQQVYTCIKCQKLLQPKVGDCCVFCSYGSNKCPLKQTEK